MFLLRRGVPRRPSYYCGGTRLRLVVLNYIPRFLTRESRRIHTGGRTPCGNSELIASAISREPARRRSRGLLRPVTDSLSPRWNTNIGNDDGCCAGDRPFARNCVSRGPVAYRFLYRRTPSVVSHREQNQMYPDRMYPAVTC